MAPPCRNTIIWLNGLPTGPDKRNCRSPAQKVSNPRRSSTVSGKGRGKGSGVPHLTGPYLAFGIPFCVLVLQSFFRQVPDEIIEAARIDGAGNWRIFFTIMLPLSTPALVTVAILDGVSTWNELRMALIILNSENSKTVPVGLLNFQGQFANNNTGLAAGILIAVVPILIAYILLQRWIVGGLTAGATKG